MKFNRAPILALAMSRLPMALRASLTQLRAVWVSPNAQAFSAVIVASEAISCREFSRLAQVSAKASGGDIPFFVGVRLFAKPSRNDSSRTFGSKKFTAA